VAALQRLHHGGLLADRIGAGKTHIGDGAGDEAGGPGYSGLDVTGDWQVGVAIGGLTQRIVMRIVLRPVEIDRHARAFPQSGRPTDALIMTRGD
jgi:hypothetical protein